MRLQAVAVDTAGQSTRSAEVVVTVGNAQGGSLTPVVYENPLPGARQRGA